MNWKRFLICSLAVLFVVMTPTISRTDVPVSTAILREQVPLQEVCRRDRLKLQMSIRTRSGNLQNVVAAGLGRGQFASGYDFGGYSAGGYEFAPRSRSVCGIDAQGYSTCPPTSYSYSLPTRSSYDLGVQSSYSFSPPVSYSIAASPSVASVSSVNTCEQMLTEILKTLLQELINVQTRQNNLLLELLRERSGGPGGAGTYEAIPPSPQRDLRPSPSNRS